MENEDFMEALQPSTQAMKENKEGICGSTLKMIALVTMLIDHTAAVLLVRIIGANLFPALQNQLAVLYYIMRSIGRIAFPIYCFLLVEGFGKTHNVWKYALRLAGFAVLSEIPFDFALNSTILEFGYQNVFFTLLWGLLAMIASDMVNRRLFKEPDSMGKKLGACAVTVACTIVAALAAEWMHTDYGAIGVVCIMALYQFRSRKIAQIWAGVIAFCWELTAPLAFIPIGFYNGERGRQIKYLFYAFYPVHLLLLYLICVLLNIHSLPAL